MRGRALSPTRASSPAHSHTALAEPAPLDPLADYGAIASRNLFRPLVAAPKAGQTTKASGKNAPGSAPPGPKPAGPQPAPTGRSVSPPDPAADLALTGIVETSSGLRALIEQLSTRKGQYVAVGETVFGFTVRVIRPKSVTVAQGPKTYELRLGDKVAEPRSMPAAASGPAPAARAEGAPAREPQEEEGDTGEGSDESDE